MYWPVYQLNKLDLLLECVNLGYIVTVGSRNVKEFEFVFVVQCFYVVLLLARYISLVFGFYVFVG